MRRLLARVKDSLLNCSKNGANMLKPLWSLDEPSYFDDEPTSSSLTISGWFIPLSALLRGWQKWPSLGEKKNIILFCVANFRTSNWSFAAHLFTTQFEIISHHQPPPHYCTSRAKEIKFIKNNNLKTNQSLYVTKIDWWSYFWQPANIFQKFDVK